MATVSVVNPIDNKSKHLISTPTKIVGEYHGSYCSIKHAWQLGNRKSITEASNDEQEFFVIELNEFPKEIVESNGLNEFRGYNIGFMISELLAILFGKVFYYHGAIEQNNLYTIPNIEYIRHEYKKSYPYNSKTRPDLNIELNLEEVNKIGKIVNLKFGKDKIKNIRELLAAAKQYLLALQYAHNDQDIAYISLVESGEIFSNSIKIDETKLYDKKILDVLNEVKELENGEKKYNLLKGKLRQISNRYMIAILEYLDDSFYGTSYSNDSQYSFTKENVRGYIKRSYDLRSKYVHNGESFGSGTMISMDFNWEINNGWNSNTSKDMKKCLLKSASFVGLERIIHYCLYKRMIEIIK